MMNDALNAFKAAVLKRTQARNHFGPHGALAISSFVREETIKAVTDQSDALTLARATFEANVAHASTIIAASQALWRLIRHGKLWHLFYLIVLYRRLRELVRVATELYDRHADDIVPTAGQCDVMASFHVRFGTCENARRWLTTASHLRNVSVADGLLLQRRQHQVLSKSPNKDETALLRLEHDMLGTLESRASEIPPQEHVRVLLTIAMSECSRMYYSGAIKLAQRALGIASSHNLEDMRKKCSESFEEFERKHRESIMS